MVFRTIVTLAFILILNFFQSHDPYTGPVIIFCGMIIFAFYESSFILLFPSQEYLKDSIGMEPVCKLYELKNAWCLDVRKEINVLLRRPKTWANKIKKRHGSISGSWLMRTGIVSTLSIMKYKAFAQSH